MYLLYNMYMSVEVGEIYRKPKELLEQFRGGLTEKDCISVVNYLEPLFLEAFEENEKISANDIDAIRKGEMIEEWADAAEQDIQNGQEPWHPIMDPSDFDPPLVTHPKAFQIFGGFIRLEREGAEPVYYKVSPAIRRKALTQFVGVTGGLLPCLVEDETGEMDYSVYLPHVIAGLHPEVQFERGAFKTLSHGARGIHDRSLNPHLSGEICCPPLFRAHGLQTAAARSFYLQETNQYIGRFNSSLYISSPGKALCGVFDRTLSPQLTTDIGVGVAHPELDYLFPAKVEDWYDNLSHFIDTPPPQLVQATIEQAKYTIAFLRDPAADLRQLPIVHSAIEAMYNVSSSVDLSQYEVSTDEDMVV